MKNKASTLQLNDLVINNEGLTGIPFNTLRREFGFNITIKGTEVIIEAPMYEKELQEGENPSTYSKTKNATDNFTMDMKYLKEYLDFKDYYQGSLIYTSENRGIKRYDVIITATAEWYNITFKGDYDNCCEVGNRNSVIPKLIEFYFPMDYEEVLRIIKSNKKYRGKLDYRDVLITNDEIDTKEIIFSIINGKLS